MTIQELYDWAKANNCLDVPIAKHTNLGVHDIEEVVHLSAELPEIFNADNDRVIIE